MRGKYKGKSGKIDKILTKRLKIYVDGIQIKKSEGSKINIPLKASNLQIIELNTDDKKRMKRKPEIKQESKK
jgi:large subunit ribosomal protein L24